MVKLSQQMANNFIETLENLEKSLEQLDREDIYDIGAAIFERFQNRNPETLDLAQIILFVGAGTPVCFACGRPLHNGCQCGEDADPLNID